MSRLPVFVVLVMALCLPGRAAERQMLKAHVPSAVATLKSIGRCDPSTRLNLTIGLPLRNQADLTRFLRELQDPASPNYRRFLTPQQFTERFGPTPQDYQALADFANAHGLKVTARHPNRMILEVEGAVSDIEKTLHVTMRLYRHPKESRNFYAPDVNPSIDLAVPVLHISGLDDYAPPHPYYKIKSSGPGAKPFAQAQNGSAPNGAFGGNDFRAAYIPGTTLTGAGQSIGLVEFDDYYANDITSYETEFGLPNVPLITVPVSGGISKPGSANGEVASDIEMTLAMAPGMSAVYVYEAPRGSSWVSLLNRMANDNLAKQLSCSWGGGGPDPTSEGIFQQMAAQGQSFFAASGDSDAYSQSIPFPSDSPSITVVGGTSLTTGSGASYTSETVWNTGTSGSSGGISAYYSIPSYQQSVSMASNQGSTTMRNVPDVALAADNIFVVSNNGVWGIFTGTSYAAPLWAGFTALVNQQAVANGQSPVGFLNPALYTIAGGGNYASAFHDITSGNNFSTSSPAKFSAVAGYDLCTGLGTPAGTALVNALAGAPAAPGKPVVTNLTGLNITAGVTFSYQITASHNPTSYSASGLPTGLAVNTTTGLIAGTPTVIGTFNVTVGAANASGGGSGNLAIIIAAPPLPAITSTLSANANNGTPFNYQITATNNPTSYNASGLPNGLSVNTGTGLISGTPTANGPFTVTLSATNLGGTGSATLSLTVAPATAPVITAVFTSLASFIGTNGNLPKGALIQGSDGNFYGTTFKGGNNGDGTVFKMTPAGTVTAVASFDGTNGQGPQAGVTQASDGNFYGTTYGNGNNTYGTLFKMTPAGILTGLYTFTAGNDGGRPEAALVPGSDGNFYGTAIEGGTGGGTFGYGTVFKTTPDGTLTTLNSFNNSNGNAPYGGLLLGSDGNFYGTTTLGGSSHTGSVFKMTPGGTLTTPSSLTDGSYPYAKLLQASDGNFYGTTFSGGGSNDGTVFKMTPGGQLTTLCFFSGANGKWLYAELIQGSDGNFYGTTYTGGANSAGTVFMLTPGGTLTVLYSFTGGNDGGTPYGALVQGSDGSYYGTTTAGGSLGEGAVFKVTTSLTRVPLGQPFSYQITAKNTPTSYSASGLPAGLSVDPTTGLVSGTPTASGSFNVTINATNPGGTGSATLTIIVQQAPSFTNGPPPASGIFNTPYNFSSTTSGYPAPAFSLTTGVLPPGLTLSSTGVIAGTPTATGAYSGTVTATNALGAASQNYSITVQAAPTPASFSQWETNHTFTGLATDIPWTDGVPNLLKYLCNIDPTRPMTPADRAALPVSGTTTSGGTLYLTLTYGQYQPETGITINVQTSSDLKTWTTLGLAAGAPDSTHYTEEFTGQTDPNGDPYLMISVPATGSSQFIRLMVTSP